MKARILCQLGMKGRGEQVSLLGGDDPPVWDRSQNFGIAIHRFDDRRPDEDRVIVLLGVGRLLELWDIQVREKDNAGALATARLLVEDFPENVELRKFIDTHADATQ